MQVYEGKEQKYGEILTASLVSAPPLEDPKTGEHGRTADESLAHVAENQRIAVSQAHSE